MSSSEKIKLVQIIADADLGGGPKHVLGLLSHIDKSKFDCYLICPSGDLARLAREIHGVEVYVTLMRSKFDLIAVRKINALLGQIQSAGKPFSPMIVHTHGPRAGLLGRWASPKGVYSVYTEHRWDGDYHLENRFNEWLQLALLKRQNLKTNLVIAVSSAVKDFLLSKKMANEQHLKVIPNAIELRNLKPRNWKLKPKAGNHFVIGNVGNLNHQKGQTYLIAAMAEVVKHFPHAMLEIVGEGPEREALEKQIGELKLEQHVTLLGRQAEPMEHMVRWDLFVLSSIAETFGIVLLEAFAMGLPIVSTDIGGVKDILKNKRNCLMVPPADPETLASAIIEMLERPAMAEQFIRHGKEKVKSFEWQEVINKIEKAYLELI